MKLKELVANSLPRVRGKKKKSPTLTSGSNTFSMEHSHSSSPVSVTGLHGGSQDLPLATQATAILSASSYPVYDDGYVRPQFGVGVGLEQVNSRCNFSTFFPSECQQRRGIKEDPNTAGLKWHGNVLYRGQYGHGSWDTGTERIFSTEMVTSNLPVGGGHKPRLYRGMTTSHSAEGISAHHLLSRSAYDARMAVSEYAGSCSSQMSVISESAVEAYSSALRQRPHYLHHHQQALTNLNAHYHQHSHQHFHHYHHHHHLPARGMPLTQQRLSGQNILNQGPPTGDTQVSFNPGTQQRHNQAKGRSGKKQELGFFRKSFASLKSMRKHTSGHSNNNTVISPAPAKPGCVAPLTRANLEASEHLRCSVCPYPDQGGVSSGRDNTEGRPIKPKRKMFRGLSKSKSKKSPGGKENRGESGEGSSCLSDNDAHSMIVAVGQPITDCSASDLYPSWDRSRHRECSVDSFSSSRVCDGSRESSCLRELDPSGIDSASMSGYDSDFPRGVKVNRSRSRIRTNPWLPSPQPSLGVCGESRRYNGAAGWMEDSSQLRESQEDMASCDDLGRLIPATSASSRTISRSASFEHRRPATLKSLTSSYHPGCQKFSNAKPEVIPPEIKSANTEKGEKNIQDTTCPCAGANQRPLTPSVDPDAMFTMSLDRPQKPLTPVIKKPSWWSFGRRNSKKENNNATGQSLAVKTLSTSSLKENENHRSKSNSASSSLTCTDGSNVTPTRSEHHISDKSSNASLVSPPQAVDEKLNDLNMETSAPVVKLRPRSIVSPNSEFVLLAGHLEQLANNISFEYEDAFASLKEETTGNCDIGSAKICNQSNKARDNTKDDVSSLPPTRVNSVFANATQKSHLGHGEEFLNLSTPESPFPSTSTSSLSSPSVQLGNMMINTAHSPDSGVGGLGSTDGDDVLSSSNIDRTPDSPHSDNIPSCEVDFDQSMINKQFLYQPVSMSGLSEQSFSCHYARVKKPLANLKQGSVGQAGSFSSTQDDDSSATISESDVDNTHYHDGTSLQGAVQATSPSIVPHQDSQGNSPYLNNHPKELNPALEHAHRCSTDVCLGVPFHCSDKTGLNQLGDTVHKAACRPNHLNTQQKPQDTVTENPLYYVSCKELNSSETSEYNTDSTNEVLAPGTGRLVRTCHLDAAMILEANLRLVKAPSVDDSTFTGDTSKGNKQVNEQLGLPEGENKESQTIVDMAPLSDDVSCMDITLSSREDEDRSLNASFDMSDACVQTDFDEDFPRWDEIDALESLEENALDPAESTRRWLLTGNMMGSADTGYASQTRGSQLFVEDDTRHLTDESSLPWLCGSDDRFSDHSSEERTPRNSACFDTDFDFAVEHQPHSTRLRAFLEDGPVMYRPVLDSKIDKSHAGLSKKACLKQEKPAVPPKPRQNTVRPISPGTVDQMFCDIEQQFEDIFQQRCGHARYNFNPPNPKRFSDSSDSTLESECSVDSSYSGGVPVGELHDVAARCRDMRTVPGSYDWGFLADKEKHDSKRDGASRNSLSVTKQSGKPVIENVDPKFSKVTAPTRPSTFHAINQQSRARDARSKTKGEINLEGSFMKSSARHEKIVSPKHDQPDYLEFLLDSPLQRSNLKRPLFIVPGVGTVDISCPDSLYSNTPFSLQGNLVQKNCTSDRDMNESSSLPRHLAKKSKFKDKAHKNSSSKIQLPHEQPKDMMVTDCVKNSTAVTKSRHHSTSDKRNSQLGHKHKITSKYPRSSLSFENKSYQSLGEHWMKKQVEPKTISTAECEILVSDEAKSSNKVPHMEEETRILAEKVQALRREKDEVYRKLQAAQLDEISRKGNLEDLRRHAHFEHKETLLRTLRELRDKLERQKKLLQEKVKTSSQNTIGQTKKKTP